MCMPQSPGTVCSAVPGPRVFHRPQDFGRPRTRFATLRNSATPGYSPHSPRELETPASRPHKPGLAMSRLSDQTKCQRWRLSRKVWSRTWLKNKLGITDKWSHKGTHRAHAHKCCDRLHFLHFKEMYGNTD